MSAVFNINTNSLSDFLYHISEIGALPYELAFKAEGPTSWTSNNYPLCLIILVIYMLFLYFGTMIMSKHEAFDLKIPLALWNAFLCTFSFLGMCRTVPFLLANIVSKTFEETVCSAPAGNWGSGPSGFWVMLFIFSKVPELIDTVFIVLRKKPLIFLHWYHHVSVLLFCWNAYACLAGSGLYFVAMNYTVHALMYGYYCLAALSLVPKSFPAYLITFSQIGQMFIGTFVCISGWYYKLRRETCHNDFSNLAAGAIMYGSYCYLFVSFAMKRYGKKEKKVKKLE